IGANECAEDTTYIRHDMQAIPYSERPTEQERYTRCCQRWNEQWKRDSHSFYRVSELMCNEGDDHGTDYRRQQRLRLPSEPVPCDEDRNQRSANVYSDCGFRTGVLDRN